MSVITNNISGSVSNSSVIGITGSVIIGNASGGSFPVKPTDTVFFVSGSNTSRSVFGGTVFVSGSLFVGTDTLDTITLGSTAQTGTTLLGQSIATNTINIGNANTADTETQTINIGAGTGVTSGKSLVTIGSTANDSALTLNAGSGSINIGTSDSIRTTNIATGMAAQTINIGTGTTGTQTINLGSSVGLNDVQISIGNYGTIPASTTAIYGNTVSIGDSAGNESVSIGSATGFGNLIIQTGTGDISIGTSAYARTTNIATGAANQTVTLGSTDGGSALTLNAGSGAINIGTSASARVTNIATGMASQTVNICTGNTGTQTIKLGIALGPGTSQTITSIGNYGTTPASTTAIWGNTVSIGEGLGTDTTVTIGEDAGASSIILQSGTGGITQPNQPGFLATPTSSQSNFAINVDVKVLFGTERFDNASNFASSTFTAPVTGKYILSVNVYLALLDIAATYYYLDIVTSNKTYRVWVLDPTRWSADLAYYSAGATIIADMDASDTALINIFQSGGTAQTDIISTYGGSYFSGYLLG